MVLPVYDFAVPAPETGPLAAARRAAVGRRMRSLRNLAGLTQAAVAEESGLTRQFYLAVRGGPANPVPGQPVRDCRCTRDRSPQPTQRPARRGRRTAPHGIRQVKLDGNRQVIHLYLTRRTSSALASVILPRPGQGGPASTQRLS